MAITRKCGLEITALPSSVLLLHYQCTYGLQRNRTDTSHQITTLANKLILTSQARKGCVRLSSEFMHNFLN